MMTALMAPLLVTGCLATSAQLQEPVAAPVAAPVALASPAGPLAKDEKLLEEGKPVNDYVNSNLPSQIGYSIAILNQQGTSQAYPQIQDLSEEERALLTEEERRKLEEELLSLQQSSK